MVGDPAPVRSGCGQRGGGAAGGGAWLLGGCSIAVYDPEARRFYCYLRARWPLGDRRGGLCRILESADAVAPAAEWTTVWEATRAQFGANSVERSAPIRDLIGGEWRLYVSSETAQAYDRNPAKWRVDLLQASGIGKLEPRERRVVMDATMYGFSHVKDPVVLVVGGAWLALTSVAWRDQHLGPDEHGLVRSRGRGMIALHRSIDGIDFPEAQVLAEPGPGGWGGINVRPSAVAYHQGCWSLLFDEGAGRANSYDEQCMLATSTDLVSWRRLTPAHRPWVRSSHASGSVRYVDVVLRGETRRGPPDGLVPLSLRPRQFGRRHAEGGGQGRQREPEGGQELCQRWRRQPSPAEHETGRAPRPGRVVDQGAVPVEGHHRGAPRRVRARAHRRLRGPWSACPATLGPV